MKHWNSPVSFKNSNVFNSVAFLSLSSVLMFEAHHFYFPNLLNIMEAKKIYQWKFGPELLYFVFFSFFSLVILASNFLLEFRFIRRSQNNLRVLFSYFIRLIFPRTLQCVNLLIFIKKLCNRRSWIDKSFSLLDLNFNLAF